MVSERSHLHQLINLDVMPESGLRTKAIPERATAWRDHAPKLHLSLPVTHYSMKSFEMAFIKMESVLLSEVDDNSFLTVR